MFEKFTDDKSIISLFWDIMSCFKELLSYFQSLQFNIFCTIHKFVMMFSKMLKGVVEIILSFMNLNGKAVLEI